MPSPDDYRRNAAYRRSDAGTAQIGHNAPPAGPVQAFDSVDINSPLLREFLMGGRTSSSGLTVTQRLALKNSSFFRSCNLIASTVGMLPTQLHRRLPDGQTEKAKDHALYRVLARQPNGFQTPFEFKSYMQFAALLDGNAYGKIVWGLKRGRKVVLQIIPYPRGRVKTELTDDLQLIHRYTPKNGSPVILPANEVFHFRHPLTLDGVNGISLLDVAVETLGLAAAAERALGKLMDKGVMASGAIQFPNELGDKAYENLKRSLAEDHTGAENAASWFILEQGGEANAFASAKDSQTDEMRARQDENIARFTDVPRPLLMMDETAWGSGIRELGLFLVTYCLMKWFIAWEQAFARTCFTEQEQEADELYVKFNEGALLRGSLKEQADFFSKALGNNAAWMEPNEVRANFELNPLSDGNGLPKPAKAAPPAPKETEDD
jgi:phage portal protein, HK97 family